MVSIAAYYPAKAMTQMHNQTQLNPSQKVKKAVFVEFSFFRLKQKSFNNFSPPCTMLEKFTRRSYNSKFWQVFDFDNVDCEPRLLVDAGLNIEFAQFL
jgi:hypothetical protein